MALHVALYLSDALPLHLIAFSVFSHLIYLQNFSSTWPTISLTSISFIASCILVVADHFLWFFHFANKASLLGLDGGAGWLTRLFRRKSSDAVEALIGPHTTIIRL